MQEIPQMRFVLSAFIRYYEILKWFDAKNILASKHYPEQVIRAVDYAEEIEGVNLIKMHGSGTNRNTEVEYEAINEFDCRKIEYKSEIGHTQGASSIVEICMMLGREEFTKALVLASGLGGFYGGCVINKE